ARTGVRVRMAVSLSIIIPAFNEARRIGKTLKEIFEYLASRGPDSELIVVDDGSTDETARVVQKVFALAPSRISSRLICIEPNRGKGAAVRAGLLDALAPVALFSDADLSTPIDQIEEVVLPIYANRYDVVFGSRSLDRSMIGKRQPWMREQSGRIFNLMMKLMTGMPYVDTQCGFKAFRLGVCRPIAEGGLIDRFGFDVELLYLAHQAGLRLPEQPVRWNDVEGSKVSLRTGLHGFGELRQLRRNARLGLYDATIQRTRQANAQSTSAALTPVIEAQPGDAANVSPRGKAATASARQIMAGGSR